MGFGFGRGKIRTPFWVRSVSKTLALRSTFLSRSTTAIIVISCCHPNLCLLYVIVQANVIDNGLFFGQPVCAVVRRHVVARSAAFDQIFCKAHSISNSLSSTILFFLLLNCKYFGCAVCSSISRHTCQVGRTCGLARQSSKLRPAMLPVRLSLLEYALTSSLFAFEDGLPLSNNHHHTRLLNFVLLHNYLDSSRFQTQQFKWV